MNPRVFREYDIRGAADGDFSDDFVYDLGRAIGTHMVRAGAKQIAVGRDCRVSSPRMHAALVDGLLTTPLHLLDVGIVPTPVLYYAPFHFELDGGVQLTGSHNPPQDNGYKVYLGDGSQIVPPADAEIAERILQVIFAIHERLPLAPRTGARIDAQRHAS